MALVQHQWMVLKQKESSFKMGICELLVSVAVQFVWVKTIGMGEMKCSSQAFGAS